MIKWYLKAVSIVIKNLQMICSENGEKKRKNVHFVLKKCTFRFCGCKKNTRKK